MIRVRMSAKEFQQWRADRRAKAVEAAQAVAPEAYYIRTVGWCGPGWEKAMDAYCQAFLDRETERS